MFFIDSLGCGGAEKSLVSLLPLLDYNRLEVDLMMVNGGGIFECHIPESVNVIPFHKEQGIHKIWFNVCLLFFSLLLRLLPNRHGAELRWITMSTAYSKMSQKYDVAIAYQQGFPTYYVATKVQAAKKYAWINVDMQKAGYNVTFNRCFYDKMNKVVAVSNTLHEMLEKTGYVASQKLYTIYDILNVPFIRRMALEKVTGYKCPEGCTRLATVGRLVPQKNYPLAVETAKLLKERRLHFVWHFVGDGSDRPVVEKLIFQYGLQDCIHLTGMCSNPYPYMASCDIYVQSSGFEGFGLTLCEARILNKPVVSTNFPVVYSQIQDGRNGLIAEMTAESLADKIMLLVSNRKLREHLIEMTKRENNQTAITESRKVNVLLNA